LGRALLLGGVAVALFVAGGLFGFLLRQGAPWAAPVAGEASAAAAATDTPDDAPLKRLKDLQALNDKLGRELESQKTLTAEARSSADAARQDVEQTLKTKDDRVGELEELAERLKMDLAEAKAREVAATRDAERARKAPAQPPQDRINKGQEPVVKKLSDELEAQKRLTQAAKKREEAVRRDLEQVRREGQRTLEQVRRESQQTLEQVRREGQQALEQLRRQLQQQQKATQQARAEAEKHKRAAEEAIRKSK
jgi:hypothetical protein